MVELISPPDAIFLVNESREHPMHVGSLQLFQPPDDAGPDFARTIHEQMLAMPVRKRLFRKRPGTLLGGISSLTWSYDDEVDLDYHLRRSALPAPGRVRELLDLTSRLHSSLLDRHRPLWEQRLIEGLDDGRLAVYTKVHHALIDGVSAQLLLQRTLSTDPNATDVQVPWSSSGEGRRGGGPSLAGRAVGALRGIGGIAPSTLALAKQALAEHRLALPFDAPDSMFNVRIGGARRCAAQSWPLARIRAVKAAAGVTVNDVVLAMCSAALRSYLLEHDALPDRSLIAMVPVSLRHDGADEESGNSVGTILCNLGTHLPDPAERLRTISESMSEGKRLFAQMPKTQALAVSALMIAPLGLSTVPGFVSMTRPPFNIVISNVPGPREPMYWNGARLDGNYPMSIVLDGQALNITVTSNADNLDFGVVGCRRSVPHLQRILRHLETGLAELEHVTT
ncbi:WS/DGAT/MGAT family O-acyltransferase [Nocardia amikacinitolerans]|uniref:WS/DGAT/MGAT family O-acyltransferase n=1 Tax=Nocardia amikacinitolerans TaxID=756689 RepID=UPI0020A493AD|nr:wax ester/triacylglycerol synthase family O-acyltransferase [Nocardia amikacinitolerans]MCP2277459.1 acyltransferase, WS/DGAT/MGAT [Nocardia amikacinitolerans]